MAKQSTNLLNMSQAANAVGITRKTLYAHVERGLVSITTQNGKRFIDVSELIRHYGTVSLPEEKLHTTLQPHSTHQNETLIAMQKELAELRKLIEGQQLLLEDKLEADRLREEMNGIKMERDSAIKELEVERSKSLWKRLTGK